MQSTNGEVFGLSNLVNHSCKAVDGDEALVKCVLSHLISQQQLPKVVAK